MKLLTSVPFVILLTLALIFGLLYGAANFVDDVEQNIQAAQQAANDSIQHAEEKARQAAVEQDSAYLSSHYATESEQPAATTQPTIAAKPTTSLPTNTQLPPAKTTDKPAASTTPTTPVVPKTDNMANDIKTQASRGTAPTSSSIAANAPKTNDRSTSSTSKEADLAAQKARTTSASTTTSSTSAKTYPYLVSAGAFLNTDKAQSVLAQMKGLGYKDAYFQKVGTMTKVIIAAFATEKDAKDLVTKLATQNITATVTKK